MIADVTDAVVVRVGPRRVGVERAAVVAVREAVVVDVGVAAVARAVAVRILLLRIAHGAAVVVATLRRFMDREIQAGRRVVALKKPACVFGVLFPLDAKQGTNERLHLKARTAARRIGNPTRPPGLDAIEASAKCGRDGAVDTEARVAYVCTYAHTCTRDSSLSH